MLKEPQCDHRHIEVNARKIKVCGHPLRFKILCLIEGQDACVKDLWQCLDVAQPVISQHLATLKKECIVESSVEGNRRLYRIEDDFIRRIIQIFLQQLLNEGSALG